MQHWECWWLRGTEREDWMTSGGHTLSSACSSCISHLLDNLLSSSPIARTQRPLFGKAARPPTSDCFWFQWNDVFSAVAFHQLRATSARPSSAGGETQALPGSDSIQHCGPAVLPLSVPQQTPLDVKPHLLAQIRPLELLSTTQLEGCQQQGHHSSCSS